LTELSARERITEFFYELNKGLEAIFSADKPLGKENSSSTHVSDLHPTSNMIHYENTRNDQLTKYVKFSVFGAFATLINLNVHASKITIYSTQ
jgi:hypothetical protein